jgi:hypothetical protein
MDMKLDNQLDLKPAPDISKMSAGDMVERGNKADIADYKNGRDAVMHATVAGTKVNTANGVDFQTIAVPCPPEGEMKKMSPEHEVFAKLAKDAKLPHYNDLKYVEATPAMVFDQCSANYTAASGVSNSQGHSK